MEATYEFFDHTADIGIRVWAASLAELLAPAGRALYEVIGELIPTEHTEPVELDLKGDEAAILLRDYLSELLVMFDRDERMATSVQVARFDDERLTATVRTAAVDSSQSDYQREVKAITYHELAIRKVSGGFEATFIVDI